MKIQILNICENGCIQFLNNRGLSSFYMLHVNKLSLLSLRDPPQDFAKKIKTFKQNNSNIYTIHPTQDLEKHKSALKRNVTIGKQMFNLKHK